MDNKRWGKRFSTIFWWSLAILPLIITLIYFIGYHLTFNSGISSATDLTSYHTSEYGEFGYYLYVVLLGDLQVNFYDLGLPFLNDMFENLFIALNQPSSALFGALFGWMSSVFFYHVIFDVAVWIFRFCHNFMERWCSE